MPRNALIFVALVLLSGSALSATKGVTSKQFFSCDSAYTLWEVLWIGASTSGPADLMEGTTNINWSVKAQSVSTPAGAIAPATNLRWYRVRSQTFIPFLYSYTSMCWVPQQRCDRSKRRR